MRKIIIIRDVDNVNNSFSPSFYSLIICYHLSIEFLSFVDDIQQSQFAFI